MGSSDTMKFTDNTTGHYEWGTPIELFNELNQEFRFTVDVCSSKQLSKCHKYYDIKDNGLVQDWTGERCWLNPPYGQNIGLWVEKAYHSRALVVCLLPARTDTRWFHQWVLRASEIRFIQGRLRFDGAKDGAKFPSMIVVFNNLKGVIK